MSKKFFQDRREPFEFYPELLKYPEFDKAVWSETEEYADYTAYQKELARMVIFMYDPGSPLLKEKDIAQARSMAVTEAFKMNPPFMKELLAGEIGLVSDMAIRFLKMTNNYKLSALIGNRELLYKLTQRMMAPMTVEFGDDKEARYFTTMIKASQEMKGLITTVQDLELELFGSDNKLTAHYVEDLGSTINQTAAERFAKSK